MRYVQGLLLLTLVAWLVCETQQFGLAAGPYDIVINQLYACEDQGTGLANVDVSLYLGPPDDTKQRKRKRLHKGSFSWPFTKEQMAAIELEADNYQKKSSDYLLWYKYSDNFCNTMTTLGVMMFSSWKEAIGLPAGEGCDIPAGNYSFNDWEIPLGLPTPMLEYGAYKINIRFISEKKMFLCLELLGDVKPKGAN